MADESHGISSTVEDSLQSPPPGRESCLPRHRAPREESSVSVGEISVTGNNNPVLCGSDGNTLNFQKSADSDPKVLSTSTTSADETSGPLVLSKKSTSSQQREISTGEETIEDTLPPTPSYTRSSTQRVESLKIAGNENCTFVGCNVNIMKSSADSGIRDPFSSVDTSVGSDSRTSLTNHEVTGGKKETIDEGVIFLIDCYDPMFQESKDGEDCPFQLTIKTPGMPSKTFLYAVFNRFGYAVLLMQVLPLLDDNVCIKCTTLFQKMIVFSNKADHQAVLLLGNDIHILQNLQRPGAPQIEELEALVTDHSSLRSRHGYIADSKLNHALQKCRSLFSQRSDCVTIRRKRIFLFTNLDGPQDPTVQRNSKLEARQLYKEDVEIKLVYFDDESKPFNASLIYNDLLLSKDDAFCGNGCDPDQFDARVFTTKLEAIKGPRRRLHFSLGQDLNIGIGLYNLVQEKKLTKSFSVGQNRNPADKDSSNEGAQLPARNGGNLDSSDRQNQYTKEINEAQSGSSPKKELGDDDPGGHWMYSMTYRGKEIKFTEQEKTDLCTFGETGLSLLGFKPRHEMRDGHLRPKIKDDHQLGHPMFVFPDELMVSGSTRLFSALLQRCLARDVVAICRLIVPSAWYLAPSTQIVALLPQKEELDEHGKEICPAGFHLIKLPGPRDLRKVPKRVINKVCGANNKANKMQIDKAKAMIQKLQFSFRSENYENPSLKRHMPTDDIVDNTKPNHAFFAEKADIEIDEFKRTVYPEGYAPAKKQRSQGTANALATKTMEEHVRDGSITTCTVAQLKAFCVENRLATRGKKADLIREVCGFYNCDPPAAK